ncbi:hypothetical protein G3N95_12065 [Paraburkholderia sp. Tr-20389]|uniref:hypothetical protein n=1 Tax=Paraburkholderia sp. Tr-20389 TaxID=2703903 RepID=UPI00197CE8CC|nr:hypothetical protein [Paraburkholderia sp. Tr-20389]MBN3753677.1 hypothetical protein [Paraburkholderia sp. Tr-20389]
MPALLNTQSMLMCPHGGTVQTIPGNQNVMIGGAVAARSTDTFIITGCPYMLGPAPHPCVQVKWVQPAAKSQADGDFLLTQSSVGLCIAPDQAVQGTVLINMAQQQVTGL